MTVYVFPNPRTKGIDWLKANLAAYPPGTTVSANFPTALSAPHLQVAWDGTPAEGPQFETSAIRVTAWAPKGQETVASDVASLARKHMAELASSSVWRTTRGAGRLPGVDPDTGLPFCTFTVNADLRPL